GEPVFELYDSCDRTFRPRFSRDGLKIITARLNTAKLWSAERGTLLARLDGHRLDIKVAEFSPDGARVITASVDDTAKLWDATTGKMLISLNGHHGTVRSATFSPDSRHV